jgi:hypothetical protein
MLVTNPVFKKYSCFLGKDYCEFPVTLHENQSPERIYIGFIPAQKKTKNQQICQELQKSVCYVHIE